MDDRDNTQTRKTEPSLGPLAEAGPGVTQAPPVEHDFPQAGEMPAWLKESEPQPSMLGRRVLAWGAALLAVGALAAGGLWLRDEQKSRVELETIAKSSRAADAAIAAAAPALTERKPGASSPVVSPPPAGAPADATALIERKPSTLPPLVTLPPEQTGVAAHAPVPGPAPVLVPGPGPAPVPAASAPSAPERAAPVIAARPEPVVPLARPAKTVSKPTAPVGAKAAPKMAVTAPVRTLRAAAWPPAPSRKLPLAQNVIPKATAKTKRQAAAEAQKKASLQLKPKLAATRDPVKAVPKKTALARPAAKGRVGAPVPRAHAVVLPPRQRALTPPAPRERGVMLPPPREREVVLPAPRERAVMLPAPREPVPVPRPCGKGELARDCAN